jgi:hypothetical protein
MQVLAGDVKLAADTFNNFIAVWQKFGVLPERYHYLTAQVHSTERHYPLRPELMESALYLLQARPAAPSACRPLSSFASTVRRPYIHTCVTWPCACCERSPEGYNPRCGRSPWQAAAGAHGSCIIDLRAGWPDGRRARGAARRRATRACWTRRARWWPA